MHISKKHLENLFLSWKWNVSWLFVSLLVYTYVLDQVNASSCIPKPETGTDVASHPKQVDLAHMKLDGQRLTGVSTDFF